MKPFLALLRKQLHESRWTMGLSAAVLFGLGWLFVWVTSLNEAEIVRRLGDDSEQGRIRMLRMMGVTEEPTSISLIMASWSHPFILLLISIWAIGRGSAAVAAEVERGTLDLLLSRPIPRWVYLSSSVIVSLLGLVVLAGASWEELRSPSTTTSSGSARQPWQCCILRSTWLRSVCRSTDIRCWLRHSTTCVLESDLDRKRFDSGRVRRARDLSHPGASGAKLGAICREDIDLQGLQSGSSREWR